MHIVFLDSATIPHNLKIPRPCFAHTWTEYPHTAEDDILARAQDAQVIITNKVVFRRDLLERLPKLKLIALTATGTDNIDVAAANELGIVVKNVAGYSGVCVPEHVLGMIFALKHSFAGYHRDQVVSDRWATCGRFCYVDHPITDIRGSTLGIIGKGNLGSETARLAEAVGMKVVFAEHRHAPVLRPGYRPFEEVLKTADIVSLHCPLTETTRNLINVETLALMKSGAYLINTGRGPLVDENALLEALESGVIAGAALDVLVKEPPEKDNPLMIAAKRLPNLLITPHVAWASKAAVTDLVNKVTRNIEDFILTGK